MTPLLTLATLAGLWQADCAQTQVNGRRGYARDQLEFAAEKVTRRRVWFEDSACKTRSGQIDETTGAFTLGKVVEVQNDWTIQAMDWKFGEEKTEKGAIGTTAKKKTLRVAFGFGKDRNTMLELIGFERVGADTAPGPR